MKFCCNNFESNFNEAGKHGLSVLIKKDIDGYIYFVFQSRTIVNESRQITFQNSIKYCPWCGTKLEDIIDENKKQVNEFVEKHKGLLIGIK